MDDVNVNELSEGTQILVYKKFFGGKIYDLKLPNDERVNAVFKIKDITLCYGGGYRVWCEILSVRYYDKNKISTSRMNILQSYFKKITSSDLNLCSIDDVDVVIVNRDNFEIIDKKSLPTVKGGYEFYKKSIQNYSYNSTKNDLESLMSGYKLKIY